MADSDKTEEPTEHKLEEARKKGQVAKSQDVTSTLLLIATVGTLSATGAYMGRSLMEYSKKTFALIPKLALATPFISGLTTNMVFEFFKILIPMLAVAFIFAIVGNVAQIGFLFTFTPMSPSLSKINPIQGFKKMFSMRSAIELAKQLMKLFIVGYISFKTVSDSILTFKMMPVWDFVQSLVFIKSLAFKIMWNVAGASIVIAILDYLLQKKMFLKDQRMSFKELKDEYKETEGNPEVKAKQKEKAQEIISGAMMGNVADASAVVTNPTHLAVAIKYEHGQMEAPVVVAKGERLIAERIKELANEHEVPIIENIDLARALFKACKVGDAIPPELYKAVAEVLAFVYKLKRKKLRLKRRKSSFQRSRR